MTTFRERIFLSDTEQPQGLTQAVTLVDDRCDLFGPHEVVHYGQVVFVRSRKKHKQFLANEP